MTYPYQPGNPNYDPTAAYFAYENEKSLAYLRTEVERLRAHVAELSRVLNGITNRPDMAEKTLAALEDKP